MLASEADAFSLQALLDDPATGDALVPALREIAFAHLLADVRAPRARRVCKAFDEAYGVGNARFQLIADRGSMLDIERRSATTRAVLRTQRERTRFLADSVQFNRVGKLPCIERPTHHPGIILMSGTDHLFIGRGLPEPRQ